VSPDLHPHSATVTRVLPDTYIDSVLLLQATRTMSESAGVSWATAVMATPANVAALREEMVVSEQLDAAKANDLVLAVRALDQETGQAAVERGVAQLFVDRSTAGHPTTIVNRTLDGALRELPDANVAVVSVPGPYAALEAHKALSAGLDVLLFSDNVGIDEEIALKDHALSAGRLLMGPGAGTAMLGGCCLGFCNVVRAGRVGVVAAAGTGAQEVMTLLDRWGEGLSHVIGVGGRDLSERVGGRMAAHAVQALDDDPSTELILLVSKPPSPPIARAVIGSSESTPVVAALVGLPEGTELGDGTRMSSTLEGGVLMAMEALGSPVTAAWASLRREVEAGTASLAANRRLVRGFYSGGTLCYEALTLLEPWVGPVWSNTPLDDSHHVPAPPGSHVCLDLGEEEYTQGRPHPMIDPGSRIELLHDVTTEPDVGVVLLDVVLGYGAHADPASQLAPACAEVVASGPSVVVYVLGTDADPQQLSRQRDRFRDAGCVIAPTGARAALTAVAIAERRPELVEVAV
jgi:FdrA protein